MRRLAAPAAVAVALALPSPTAASADPPETMIIAGPTGSTPQSAVSFGFTSNQPEAGFECRLDGGSWTLRAPGRVLAHLFDPRWAHCSSPSSYAHIDDGPHLFEVRAVNSNGDIDPSPAQRSFVVDTRVAGTLSAREVQRPSPNRVQVTLRISAGEQLAVRARGQINVHRADRSPIRFELRRRTVAVAAGRERALRMRPSRRSEGRRVAAAMRRGHRVRAVLRAGITNSAGNSVLRRLEARLRPPRPG
jgi:hypothetical protein